jgi:hypothetical protein
MCYTSWKNTVTHDGAPAHFSRAVRNTFSHTHHRRWLGREGSTAWPPRSPDFSPLDIYLRGHLISLYAAPIDKEETFHYRRVDTCETTLNYPGIFKRMWRSMVRGIEACVQSHGEHSEHWLQMYSFSYNLLIKCFQPHICMDIFSSFVIWNSWPVPVLTVLLLPAYKISECHIPEDNFHTKSYLYKKYYKPCNINIHRNN